MGGWRAGGEGMGRGGGGQGERERRRGVGRCPWGGFERCLCDVAHFGGRRVRNVRARDESKDSMLRTSVLARRHAGQRRRWKNERIHFL